LAGAGIDVFDPEPPEVGDVLRDHPLIVATPHSATVTTEGRIRIVSIRRCGVRARCGRHALESRYLRPSRPCLDGRFVFRGSMWVGA
jgi:phosphoglycerate dehydrogenase-like enzyme